MSYQVLARKYRSQKFSELIGQDVMVRTLVNAINCNRIPHAFILVGIRGVGKTSTARLIAKSLNCIGSDHETDNPCLECVHCKAIANGLDQDVIEFDAASHTGVNDIREIIETINYPPVSSRYKIYIIDEVHMLSNSAFNALLKTLEEPPEHVKFIFATTEVNKVPITILSRCIRFDLNRVDSTILADYLREIAQKEGYELSHDAANLLALAADGSVRDALSLTDRTFSYNNFEKVIDKDVVLNILNLNNLQSYYKLYETFLTKNVEECYNLFSKMYLVLNNFEIFINELLTITHKILLYKNKINQNYISEFEIDWLKNKSGLVTMSSLFRIWQFLIRALQEIKFVNNKRNFIDILLLKIIYGYNIPEIDDLIKKIKTNENKIETTKEENLVDKVLNKFEGSKLL